MGMIGIGPSINVSPRVTNTGTLGIGPSIDVQSPGEDRAIIVSDPQVTLSTQYQFCGTVTSDGKRRKMIYANDKAPRVEAAPIGENGDSTSDVYAGSISAVQGISNQLSTHTDTIIVIVIENTNPNRTVTRSRVVRSSRTTGKLSKK
jgi:hypothetical protein